MNNNNRDVIRRIGMPFPGLVQSNKGDMGGTGESFDRLRTRLVCPCFGKYPAASTTTDKQVYPCHRSWGKLKGGQAIARQSELGLAGAVLLALLLLLVPGHLQAQLSEEGVFSTQGTQFVKPKKPLPPKPPEPPAAPELPKIEQPEVAPVAAAPPPRPAAPPPKYPSVVILLDASDSMLNPVPGQGRHRLDEAKAALVQVVRGMSAETRVQLWIFNTRIYPVAIDKGSARSFIPIGRPGLRRRLIEKIGAIRTGGGTNLYKAIITTLKIFADPADQPLYRSGQRFPVLVVISDGEDSRKTGHSLDAVLAARKRYPLVTINTVGFHIEGEDRWFRELCRIATSPQGCATAGNPGQLQAILESFYKPRR